MAEIIFSSPEAEKRFKKCKEATEKEGDTSLQKCIDNLKAWAYPISIGCDFDKLSFSFAELLPKELTEKGCHGVCGAIIYHGKRDNFGCGGAPTFAVNITPTTGYSIHT